jgi:hypothetical protein
LTSQEGWTVPDALAQFAAAGMPLDETGFRAVVRAARRLGTLQRTGSSPSGPKGGRGEARYDIARLQLMHKDLVGHIPAQDADP